MDSISTALAANQSMIQSQLALAVVKMAAESQQQLVALLTQAAQSGQSLASNPAHLGQSIDTFA